MVNCSNCGNEIGDSAFCPHCGKKIEIETSKAICPKCGENVGEIAVQK